MKNPCCILFFLVALSVSAQEKITVFFDFDKDVPTEKSAADLQQWIKANPNAVVTGLAGFCDSVDTGNYNKKLASRRIKSVQKMLEHGAVLFWDNMALETVGEDFKQSPIQADNRRVDIIFRQSKAASTDKPEVNPVADSRKTEMIFDAEIPEVSLDSQFKNAKIGDVIRMRNINFFLNSEVVVPQSEPRLDSLFAQMQKNPKLSIEIHGHICCNPDTRDTKLSYRRAKYIFTYLLNKGIPLNRLAYKGFGSSRPIYPIPERTFAEQAENRRVEIKIINI